MATDSRGHAPGTTLQTDIPSGRLIIDRVDDPLEFRGAHRRYQSIGGSNPSVPILKLSVSLPEVNLPSSGFISGVRYGGEAVTFCGNAVYSL